jgi:hypothetical protein
MNKNIYFRFDTVEFIKNDKPVDWYWYIGILTVIIAFFSYRAQNYILIALTLIASGIILVIGEMDSKTIEIIIDDEKIITDDAKYYYKDLDAFWISLENYDGVPKLILDISKSGFEVDTIILPEDVNLEALREWLLSQKVEEREMEEPFAYRMAHRMGFN